VWWAIRVVRVGIIRGFKEGEERVGRLVAPGAGVGWGRPPDRSFFESEVGVEVDLSGVDPFVA